VGEGRNGERKGFMEREKGVEGRNGGKGGEICGKGEDRDSVLGGNGMAEKVMGDRNILSRVAIFEF
jgi:hypothetical protein